MNHPNETLYNAGDTSIRISPDNEQSPNAPSDARANDVTSNSHHTVNVDVNTRNTTAIADSRTVQQNFLSFLHEARSHLGGRPSNHQTAANNDHVHLHQNHELEDSNINRWRVNLNNVLSFSAGPSTETIRSWIPRSGTFRYVPLSRAPSANAARGTSAAASDDAIATNDVVINLSTTGATAERSENNVTASLGREPRTSNSARISLSRTNSVVLEAPSPGYAGGETDAEAGTPPPNQPSTSTATHRNPSTPPPPTQNELDDDNLVYDLAVKVLSHFVRYLPFIGIVLLKTIYDHVFGILDILILHITVYQLNKSLCDQVAKMSQKSLSLLFRDYLLLTLVVVYRFMMADSRPDWFGLLINTATDPHSLGQLLYAVAVNDLILKLITIKIKILVTALPTDVIKHKTRGRLFALIEAISEMYRSLVPVKSWLLYLLVSYNGLDIIVGMFFFSSLYMGAKAFEFVERGKFLKKSFCSFLRNVDYGRQPTKEEMNEAGTLCPICHDNYDTPVVLECNHIFCEVCVGTWFKREQTCPMCRAKVADDPTWQNGSTTLFYQFC